MYAEDLVSIWNWWKIELYFTIRDIPLPLFLFQLHSFDVKYNDLQQEAIQSQDRNRQSLQELSAKEEELVVVKVELSALQEKYKANLNEVNNMSLWELWCNT